MISFHFITTPHVSGHAHAEIELLYLIHGSLRMRVGGNEHELKSDDYLIVNSGTVHEFSGSSDLLLGEFHIQPDKLSEALSRTDLRFRCNSAATDVPEQYEPPREIMREIFSRFHNNQARDVLRMNSLYYRLLHQLSTSFLIVDSAPASIAPLPTDSRTGEITEYIRRNYDKPIRLNDLADQLHLSVAYLSKYIKKNLGMSFLDYVASIRLSHAVTALLHTNASVAHIAMDTGFANLSSFNKVFRDHYHTTPSAFRNQYRAGTQPTPTPFSASLDPADRPQHEPSWESAAISEESNQIFLSVSPPVLKPEPLTHAWCKMINIGCAADLLRTDVQQHVLLLRDRLHYRYIRFWDLYSPDLLLNAPSNQGIYTFSRLDKVLDFLLQNNLKPYIELGDKPRRVFLRYIPTALSIDQPPAFSSDEAFYSFLRQFSAHLLARYGSQEVESWYFEYWKTESSELPQREQAADRAYLDRFDRVAEILRSAAAGIRIGGGGFSLRFGEENLRQLVRLWKLHPQQPSFVSLYCYPVTDRSEKTAVIENQLVNPNSIKKSLEVLRDQMQQSALDCQEVHVTEWNISVINRSVLNDSYFKGAYIVKNLIDSIGLADLFGYWVASDLFAEGSDCPEPLFGGCGLITRDSIPKPAWYAIEFLESLGETLYDRSENYVVTRDAQGAWRILCHNFKHFNYQYYLHEDAQLEIQALDSLLSDTSVLNISFDLPAEAGSSWRIKTSRIGRTCGSVQELWQHAGCVSQPSRSELADLARASVPQITLGALNEYNGTLHFQAKLEYNEILLIVLSPQENPT